MRIELAAAKKGRHTKPNVWDEAAELEVWRGAEKLDPGVNYFVLMLDQMGLPTYFSCEGHPGGFYITFRASYAAALAIKNAGFFSVEVEGDHYWSIRDHMVELHGAPRVDGRRWAAEAWERAFGPLDFGSVELAR